VSVGILKAIALPTHAAETRGSGHIAHYAREFCRSKVQMSGLGKVEMSGSRYVPGHVGPGPDHEQTRVRARSFAAQSSG